MQKFTSKHHEHVLIKVKFIFDIYSYSTLTSSTRYRSEECDNDLCPVCELKKIRERNSEEGKSDDIPLTPISTPEATSLLSEGNGLSGVRIQTTTWTQQWRGEEWRHTTHTDQHSWSNIIIERGVLYDFIWVAII